MPHTARIAYTTSSHVLTMPWYARISPCAYSSIGPCVRSRSSSSCGPGPSSLAVMRDPLDVEHLVLHRLDVVQQARGNRPHEEAERAEPHQERDDELSNDEIDELVHGYLPSPVRPLEKRTSSLGLEATAGVSWGSSTSRELPNARASSRFSAARVAAGSLSFSPVSGSLKAEKAST